jgi:hypothetical protein
MESRSDDPPHEGEIPHVTVSALANALNWRRSSVDEFELEPGTEVHLVANIAEKINLRNTLFSSKLAKEMVLLSENKEETMLV